MSDLQNTAASPAPRLERNFMWVTLAALVWVLTHAKVIEFAGAIVATLRTTRQMCLGEAIHLTAAA